MKLSNMLNSAMVFAANKDVRYYLNGVNVYHENGFVVAVASTDGHCLQVLHCDIPFDTDLSVYDSFIISNEDCKKLTHILSNGTINEITVAEILEYTTPVDGRYPDVSRVIPNGEAGGDDLVIGLNYKYLAKISQSMTKLSKGLKIPFDGGKFTFRGPNESVRVEIDHPELKGVKALIVLMPMRL